MADEDVVVIGDEEKDSDQQDEAMDEYDEVVEEDDQQQPGEQAQEPEDPYANHGGDPRHLDLNRCLLLSCIPSAFLTDPYDVFSNCMLDWIAQDFKVSHDVMEKIVRMPKLQSDAENPELALRAIISFKSRVYKHRVFAQKNLAAESSIKVDTLDTIPREFVEVDEDLEIADDVGEDDDGAEEHDDGEGARPEKPKVKSTRGEAHHAGEHGEDDMDGHHGAENGDESSRPKRKEYVDEDLEAPFEICWDGAPEFQWKLCPTPADTRRLIIENVFWADLHNIFIYRVMLKAETVDISFPMRFNIEGSKQMYGKITMTFQWSMQIMNEAMRHLIYVRCPQGRRIKIFLPQTPSAMKLKEEFEGKLGRVIQPTRRMHQLVLKVLPENYELTLEAAREMFAPYVPTEVENVKDDLGQPCAIVTMGSAEDTIKAHSSFSFVTVKDESGKEYKSHVFLRGVEPHFGSLITRWDKKKMAALEGPRKGSKRPAPDGLKPAVSSKKPRGGIIRGGPRGSIRGGFPPRGGRGSYRGRGGRFDPYERSYGGGMPYDSRYEMEIRERMLKQQEMLDEMAMSLRERGGRGGYGYGRSSYGASSSYDHSPYGRSSYDPYE
ncbi:hypothetical protein Y032_0018g3674 [Ancylostoma ceylanicum]|uniref:Uncharacterized protein n=1 Tax=Ancylostoma ceylanicum TaxID=53326 RepID=A0A016V4Z5_9BILA|nr:hypothetical protein Y032_0018g3674 [Ancylostoma ceylanicum]